MGTEDSSTVERCPWTFRFQRLETSEHSRVVEGLQRLAGVSASDFFAVRGFFGRRLSLRCGGWRFIVVQNNLRPPRRQIVAFDHQSLLLPTCLREDRITLFRALGISTVDDAVKFHQVVDCDYGVLFKSSAPIIIQDAKSAKQCGIESLAEYSASMEQGAVLCWQRWGGLLYKTRIDFLATDPFDSWERVDIGIGTFRRLPFWVLR